MKTYRLIFPDFNGACRGKLITEEHFSEAGHFGMPRSALTADITGNEIKELPEFYISSGDQDMFLVPDKSTLLDVPYQEGLEQVIADVADKDGGLIQVAPRTILNNVCRLYEQKGLEIKLSSELEFYLVNPDNTQLATSQLEASYGDLNSLDRLRDFVQEILGLTRSLGLKPEMVLKESGAGQLEVTFSPEAALFMADRTLYYKQLVKDLARRHGLTANFMSLPFEDDSGSGGHVHVSIWKDGQNIMNEVDFMNGFVAGQIRYMRGLSAVFAPNPNSYKRWQLGHDYVQTRVSYAEDDRNVALRLVGQGDSRRIEHRLSGADKNPYLVSAAILAAGLRGVEQGWSPEVTDIQKELNQPLPSSLDEAIDLLPEIGDLLGDDFVRVYSAIKRQELGYLENAGPDWLLETYGPQV